MVCYRPEDLEKAEMVLVENSDLPFILFSHMQVLDAPDSLHGEGHKIDEHHCESFSKFSELLISDSNLIAAISGHSHALAFDDRGYGFQWMLPSLIEYPCAAAVLDIDEKKISGECKSISEKLKAKSFVGESWVFGTEKDRSICWLR